MNLLLYPASTSVRNLFKFIVLITLLDWTNSYTNWEHQALNRDPGASWKNLSSQTYRFTKEYGGVCRSSSDCRESAYICRKGFCECARGYKHDEKMEICLGAIGSKCMYDNHCIKRAYCKGQTICTCKLEFPVVSSDKWSCAEFGSKATTVSSSWLSFLLVFFHPLLGGYLLFSGMT